MRITGTVSHVQLEGNFWGIVGDDGNNYHPVNQIPIDFQVDGLRVICHLQEAQGASMAMWGKLVTLRGIRREVGATREQ